MTLIEMIMDEPQFHAWDPSITLNTYDERERESIRLMNNLCDALARNGFRWDRQGWVHKA